MGAPLFFLVGDDWRASRFIRTVLKYATKASVVEVPDLDAARSMARQMARPINLLIAEIASDDANSVELTRQIAAGNPFMKVLLLSGRGCPPRGLPPEWRFLSIPFTTAAFLDSVNELSGCGEARV
jgi:hypothetical protein